VAFAKMSLQAVTIKQAWRRNEGKQWSGVRGTAMLLFCASAAFGAAAEF